MIIEKKPRATTRATQLTLRVSNWSAFADSDKKAHEGVAAPAVHGADVHKGQLLPLRGVYHDTRDWSCVECLRAPAKVCDG